MRFVGLIVKEKPPKPEKQEAAPARKRPGRRPAKK